MGGLRSGPAIDPAPPLNVLIKERTDELDHGPRGGASDAGRASAVGHHPNRGRDARRGTAVDAEALVDDDRQLPPLPGPEGSAQRLSSLRPSRFRPGPRDPGVVVPCRRDRGAGALRVGGQRRRHASTTTTRSGAFRSMTIACSSSSCAWRGRRPASPGSPFFASATATATPSTASIRSAWRPTPMRTAPDCWPMRASCATGPRSTPSSAMRGRSSRIAGFSETAVVVRRWDARAEPMAIDGRDPRLDRRVRGHVARAAPSGLQIRRSDDLLRLHAVGRAGERPRGRLLPLHRAARPGSADGSAIRWRRRRQTPSRARRIRGIASGAERSAASRPRRSAGRSAPRDSGGRGTSLRIRAG